MRSSTIISSVLLLAGSTAAQATTDDPLFSILPFFPSPTTSASHSLIPGIPPPLDPLPARSSATSTVSIPPGETPIGGSSVPTLSVPPSVSVSTASATPLKTSAAVPMVVDGSSWVLSVFGLALALLQA